MKAMLYFYLSNCNAFFASFVFYTSRIKFGRILDNDNIMQLLLKAET